MSNGAHALTDADVSAVRSVWDRLITANAAGDWDTAQQLLTDDHVSLDPRASEMIQGPTAWREWVDASEIGEADIDFTVHDISGSGDLACVIWTFFGGWTEAGEDIEMAGKGLSLFRRGTDGSWRWSHNAWNPNP